jgi:hypothetical protein
MFYKGRIANSWVPMTIRNIISVVSLAIFLLSLSINMGSAHSSHKEANSQIYLYASKAEGSYTPSKLVHPQNNATVGLQNLLFQWQPPVPYAIGDKINYWITLVEIMPGQNAEDAIADNPVILKKLVHTRTSFLYPVSAPALTPGKRYAWSVGAYLSDMFLGVSEIWAFTAVDNKKEPVTKNEICYAVPSKARNGGYYSANKILPIAVDDIPYRDILTPRFYNDLGIQVVVKNFVLPISQEEDKNKIMIDLQKLKVFSVGQLYTLELTNKIGDKYTVKFKYNRD